MQVVMLILREFLYKYLIIISMYFLGYYVRLYYNLQGQSTR